MTYDYSIVGVDLSFHHSQQHRQAHGSRALIDREDERSAPETSRQTTDIKDKCGSIAGENRRAEPDSVSSNAAPAAPDEETGLGTVAGLGRQVEHLAALLDRRIARLEARPDAAAAASEAEARLMAMLESRLTALREDIDEAAEARMEARLESVEARIRQRINAALASGGRRLAELRADVGERLGPAEDAIEDLRRRIEEIEARRKPAPAAGVSGEVVGPNLQRPLNFGQPDNPVRTPPALAVITGGRLSLAASTPEPPKTPALEEPPSSADETADDIGETEEAPALAEEAPTGVTPDAGGPVFQPSSRRETDMTGRTLLALIALGGVVLLSGAVLSIDLARQAGERWLIARHDTPVRIVERDL